MHGQWIGGFQSTEWAGTITIDVESFQGDTVGSAVLFPRPGLEGPVIVGQIQSTFGTAPSVYLSLLLNAVNPYNGSLLSWEQSRNQFPKFRLAKFAQAEINWTDDQMTIHWHSDINMSGHAMLRRNDGAASQASDLKSKRMTWDQFKKHVATLPLRKFVFRGQQNKAWRLRSNFHRTGRRDLVKYTWNDLPLLHRHLSARTRHLFDRSNPDENGAFLHLAQHHGFPTPLIDWTYSPYVAAFFAFKKMSVSDSQKRGTPNVRIFLFDQDQWRSDARQISFTAAMPPHFSLLEFLSVENERLIPQQALSGLTNVDDVETYIAGFEQRANKRYLFAIDIPANERKQVMKELALMGITAGSLFPGLDGSCEELRERLFPS
ncbi:FRG domain-containing protein [Paraburkholderia sp. BR14320]|uniref:FRG domain-containing protein n=1 Tax=unclassified Paraburkholderia TaxID=2615204 RepID=UPI0034CE49A9